MTSEIPESESNITVSDLFEGWMSMPSMGNLFEADIWETSVQRSDSSMKQQNKEAAAFNQARNHLDTSMKDQSQLSLQAPEDPDADSSITRKRRGHKKSRLGCVRCKQRKIKCQEQWPSCANCIKRGCSCIYPTVFRHTQHDRIVSEVFGNPHQLVRLIDTPPTYSANDLRLFHHFLVVAHPYTAQEHHDIWVRDIPAFSHQYNYLMHSILALAGSHLSGFVDDPQGNMALLHRQKAITGLEEAFTRWPPKAEEAHVMLASSYILAYQSIHLPDGFVDHVISLRGCALISQMIQSSHMEGIFSLDSRLHCLAGAELKLKNFPALDQDLVRNTIRSLARFAHLLRGGQEIERAFFEQLVESVRPLLLPSCRSSPQISATPGLEDRRLGKLVSSSKHSQISTSYHDMLSGNAKDIFDVSTSHKVEPCRSFNALVSMSTTLSTWPQDGVLHLLSTANRLGAVVIAHYFVVMFVVSPLWVPDIAMKNPMKAMIESGEKLVESVEDDEQIKWTQYVEWPSRIFRTLRCCLNKKRALTVEDVYNMLVKDPRAFREGD